MKKVLGFLSKLGWPAVLAILVVLLAFPHWFPGWFEHTVAGSFSDLFHWGDSPIPSSPDTITVKTPPRIIDHWYERIVYRDQVPDTVTVVQYVTPPTTVDLVGAQVTADGHVLVEVLINDSTAHVLEGDLAPYGDTHVVVNPDETLHFVTSRFGFAPAFTAGVNLYGPEVSLETFYINDIPLLHIPVHLPNIVGTYRVINTEPEDRELMPGLGVSADIAPFHSPGRIGGGALYSFSDTELRGYFGISFLLYSIH
jgi:hypothetical protein